ncbi:conserved hypothetical protein [Raineyella antarctica]|uniref:Repeat protein (TIGR03843 family) n=1 Tax=Raineyella antarctica TaxID=1577474 RepID=A0A1G6HC54_9ACTN|nr:SCO1664 family protein [Raineyella antarctica]SDB91859.1 conserved hypothetical protein [Raineyella antarctica]
MHPALTTPPPSGTGTSLRILGRIRTASNATFLAEALEPGAEPRRCVWKPVAGERPLWDFPDGTLAAREVAAYELSAAVGFDVVPSTVLVETDEGGGALQTWVDVDEDLRDLVDLVPVRRVPEGWFPIVEGLDVHGHRTTLVHRDDPRLRRLALFDAVTNNSDRKGAHLLPSGGTIMGCDHGLCFHVEPKLRTILWGWAEQPLLPGEVTLLERVLDVAPDVLGDLLDPEEVEAVLRRTHSLLGQGTLPTPQDGWPSIPWPPL